MNDAPKTGNLSAPLSPRGAAGAAKWYFVVINTCGGKDILGWESQGEMTLSTAGKVVKACWLGIPRFFGNVTLGRFSIMPDHIRAVIRIAPGRPGSAGSAAVEARAGAAQHVDEKKTSPLRRVLAGFKLRSTMRVNRMNGSSAAPLWDRGHYARLIHSAQELALMQARAAQINPPAVRACSPTPGAL